MARPPEPDKRLELAQRATEILAREGIGIPAARLAEALGIKRPTLLYHFPNYSHIVESALEALLMEQAVYVISRVEEHTHPIDRLVAQIRAAHGFHEGREARIVFLSQAIAATAGERMADIIEVGNRVFEPYRRASVERLTQGMRDGTVAPCDPDAVVALVRAVTDGLLVQRVMTGVKLAPVHDLLESLLGTLKIRRASAASKARGASARPTHRARRPSTKEMAR
ncbi:MAG: TetR/AcrR family transcriptional regulator [Myxococcales bacterium]|nr:TetR/AcrR family transcriptional regulator [Myxococcales bacterium]